MLNNKQNDFNLNIILCLYFKGQESLELYHPDSDSFHSQTA